MPELELDLKGVGGSVLDSLQALRSSIMYSNNTQVISFTSTSPGEGKSVLSFYTAVSFASLEKKTLFIDCDMRKSHIHKYFSASSQKKLKGLSEYITGQTEELIFTTNYPNLDVIPCGKCPPDPSGILSSETFSDIISHVRDKYEYIVIDTPPVSVASDACIAGRLSDGVVYVVRDNYVKSKDAKHCIDLLKRSECRVLGIVSNMVKKNNSQSYYYGNYGYYDHH